MWPRSRGWCRYIWLRRRQRGRGLLSRHLFWSSPGFLSRPSPDRNSMKTTLRGEKMKPGRATLGRRVVVAFCRRREVGIFRGWRVVRELKHQTPPSRVIGHLAVQYEVILVKFCRYSLVLKGIAPAANSQQPLAALSPGIRRAAALHPYSLPIRCITLSRGRWGGSGAAGISFLPSIVQRCSRAEENDAVISDASTAEG